MSPARLEVRMDSLLPFLWGSCIPYNMPVNPAHSGLPVIRPQSRIDPTEACQSIRFRFFVSYLLALITYLK